jgi:predicted ATPase
LPLAIELAAARVPFFGLRGLADRLDDRFNILTKGRKTALPRHRTLGAMIDWSYNALHDIDRASWRRLGIFCGAFAIEAAKAIAIDRPEEDSEIVDTLGSLVEKSLVSVDSSGGQIRYRLLESLRLYALKKLVENQEAECIRRRHAQYCYERSIRSEHDWKETPSAEWLHKHSDEITDIRAALEWAFFAPRGDPVLGIRIIAASALLWFKMLLLRELRQYLQHAIQLAPEFPEIEDDLVMRMHLTLANSIFHILGPVHEVDEALDKALAIADRRGDTKSQLQIVWTRWGKCCACGEYAAIGPELERVRRILDKSSELPVAIMYENMAALSHHLWGEQKTALYHAEGAVKRIALLNTRRSGAFVYERKIAANTNLARIFWITGYPDNAVEVIYDTVNGTLTPDQSLPLGYFLVFAACPIAFWMQDLGAADEYLATLLDSRSGTTSHSWQTAGKLYERVLSVIKGEEREDGAAHEALVCDRSLTVFQADHLSTFDCRLLCPQSLAQASDGIMSWCTAEVLRARGEALLTGGSADAWPEAEKLFLRSIEISRSQGALSWELRSATSLARLGHLKGETRRARDSLSEVYGRFTQGFATHDLLRARVMLDTLA